MSKSHPCSRAVPVTWSRPPVQLCGKPAATSKMRLSAPRGASAVSCTMNCLSYQKPPILSTSAVDRVSLTHRCFAQRLSVTFATLLVRVLLVRTSWHSMSRPPWHSMALWRRFTRALVFDELFARPRADPRVIFFHALLPRAARGSLAASPATLLLRALRVGLLFCTE